MERPMEPAIDDMRWAHFMKDVARHHARIARIIESVLIRSDIYDLSIKGYICSAPPYFLFKGIRRVEESTGIYSVAGTNRISENALGVLAGAYFTPAALDSYVEVGADGASESDITLKGTDCGRRFYVLQETLSPIVYAMRIVKLSAEGKLEVKGDFRGSVVTVSIYGYVL